MGVAEHWQPSGCLARIVRRYPVIAPRRHHFVPPRLPFVRIVLLISRFEIRQSVVIGYFAISYSLRHRAQRRQTMLTSGRLTNGLSLRSRGPLLWNGASQQRKKG